MTKIKDLIFKSVIEKSLKKLHLDLKKLGRTRKITSILKNHLRIKRAIDETLKSSPLSRKAPLSKYPKDAQSQKPKISLLTASPRKTVSRSIFWLLHSIY